MPKSALSLDDFMGHKTSAPRGEYLESAKNWPLVEGSKPPVKGVNVVLHTQNSIYVLWRHGVPRVVADKKDADKLSIWNGNYVCFENEDVLKQQFKRHDDGTRKLAPKSCGICKMNEWVYQQIINNKLPWTKEVFRFEATSSQDSRVIHAGGMCNLFGRNDLADDEKAELKKHGIFLKDAWKENCNAKANYMFLVVDYDNPGSGVQVAIEPSGLGDKVQTMIADRRQSLGMDEGNPQKNPFVMQWTYNEAPGIEFGKKYHARSIDKWKVTQEDEPDVWDLIHQEPPSVDNIIRPFKILEVRAALEEACLISMPWDQFFGDDGSQQQDEPEERARPGRQAAADSKPSGRKAAPPDELAEEEFDCDACDKGPVPASAKKCPFCGIKFAGAEPDPEPEEAPPPRRPKRATAPTPASTKPASNTTAKQDDAPTGRRPAKGAFPPDSDDGDIPF